MRFTKVFMFLTMILTMMSALFLFRMKHEVVALEKNMTSVLGQMQTTQEEIGVLSSEIFVLTTPKRIQDLQSRHLKDYQRLGREQLILPGASDVKVTQQ